MASLTSVMTPNPTVCQRDTPLREVAQMMAQHDCGQIPVVERAGSNKPIGVVTDRDIAVRIVAEGRDTGSACAGDAMTTPAITISTDASVADCCDVMEQQQIRRVLVVDDAGEICGIVAQADIARSGRDEATAEVVREVSAPSTH